MKSEKITKRDEAAARRSYEDACAAAHALDLVGERWTLLVMREMMTGPKRFSDLRAGLPGLSANVLTQRLETLEAAGVVARRTLPPPSAAKVYELTPWGFEAEPIFRALGRWAVRSPFHDPTKAFSDASLMLSLRTMFDPGRAGDARLRIGFELGRLSLLANVEDGELAVEPGETSGADAVLHGPAPSVAAFIYAGAPLASLAPTLSVTGDAACATRFARFFPLPEKAAPQTSAERSPST